MLVFIFEKGFRLTVGINCAQFADDIDLMEFLMREFDENRTKQKNSKEGNHVDRLSSNVERRFG